MNLTKALTLLILLLVHIEGAHCNEIKQPNPQYDIHQIEDLPQSEVNVIYEDKRGFIWLGTLDGLFRYDGRNYNAFQIDNSNQSLRSNMILAIDEDSAGNIWVGTYGRGVSRVNPRTREIKNYDFQELFPKNIKFNDVVTIEIDHDDNMWIANWYCILKVKLDEQTKDISKIAYYPVSEQKIHDKDYIKVIHEDKQNNIWIGSNLSLRRLIEERDGELVCERFDIPCFHICNYVDDSIIAAGDDIVMLSKNNDGTTHHAETLRELSYSATKVICEDRENIWVGSRKGVVRLHKTNDRWIPGARHDKQTLPFKIPTSVVSAMTVTKDRQIWVGTRSGGAFTIQGKIKLFNNYPQSVRDTMSNMIVKAIYEDSNEGLWIGTEENGVYYQYTDERSRRRNINITINSEDNRAYSFEQTGDKSTREIMWVGTSYPNNLVALDINTLRPIALRNGTPKIGFVFALRKSGRNTLWAGTYNNGLWRLKIDDYGNVLSSQQFNNSNSSISSDIIRSLYMSRGGDLLIGTDMGVNRIDSSEIESENPQFMRNLYKNKSTTISHYILQISEDSAGNILLGTMGNGLLRYDVKSDMMSSITVDDGLPNGSVKSIVEDTQSNDLWLSTNRGISKYSLTDSTITNYDGNDGLHDCEFSELCGIRRKDGTIIFGNRFGFISFNPKDIEVSYITPKLYFTDLYINHRLVGVGEERESGRTVLNQTLEYTDHINLGYDERNFSIKFVGLNFASLLGNKYYVKLEGLEREWRKIMDEELIAQYTNIPEGNYNFRVRATNSDGVWSDDDLNLKIHISPPLSRSTMAYIVYIMLILLALYWTYWVISTISRRKQQVLLARMEQKRTEEMVQYKLEFFTNISHEFRTPLTLINIPLERMMSRIERIDDSEIVEDITEMKYNVDMLLSLVNQLIDFRKIERGKEYTKPVCTNLTEFLRSYFDHFGMLAKRQNIEFLFNSNEETIAVNIDPQIFEKVVVNILSNAFKYTPQGGRIEVMVERDECKRVAKITFRDNGYGIAKEEIPMLFDRFYQGQNQATKTTYGIGSGIGLSLTKSIVELHNGTMCIESDTNQGLTCFIELPISNGEPSTTPRCEDTFVVIDHQLPKEESDSEESLRDGESDDERDLILVVDDNDRLRQQLRKQLSDSYNIITAENGKIGLEKCLKHNPALVIADIMMPVMDGIEMCRCIKEDEAISHTPIMVLTANTTIRNQIDSFTIGGADGYLDKPFNLDILKSKIGTILHNRAILRDKFQQQSIINPEEFVTSPTDLKCLSKIVGIIKDHMSDSELSIEVIAAEYGVSRTYLNRKIKALTGVTSTHFLRNIRMKYAAKLLQQKQMNVTEVAWSVGYTDVRAFRIRFKEVFGVSPTSYNGEEPIVADLSEADML